MSAVICMLHTKADTHTGPAVQLAIAKRKRDKPPAEARRLAARQAAWHEVLLSVAAWINLSAVLAIPSWLVHVTQAEPVPAFVVMILDVILFMKLWSFWHCNHWLR